MYYVIVREKKWVRILGVICTLLFGSILILGIWQSIEKGNRAGLVVCAVIGGALTLLGICVLLDGLFRELALGHQDCYYRSMFGRTKRFALEDIAGIETKKEYIFLMDASGRRIVQFENNMENAMEAVEFILSRSGMDEQGQPRVRIRQTELRPGEKKRLEKAEEGKRKQREKWLAVESEWKERPLFYESPQWVKRLRIWAWILNLGGFAAFYLCTRLSLTASARLAALYPLAVWAFWLCFHRVMVWRKTPYLPGGAENYITVPFWGVFFLFASTFHGYVYGVENGKIWMFSLILLGVLLAGMLIVTHTKRGYMELAAPLFLLVLYVFFNIYNWPVVFHTGNTGHGTVQVLEKDMKENDKGRNNYYFTVEAPGGDIWTMEVMSSLYRETEEGDTVSLCVSSGLLGDYYYLHGLEDDCEKGGKK